MSDDRMLNLTKQTYEKISKLFVMLETHLVIRNPESVHETLNTRET